MEKANFAKRILIPTGAVFLTMVATVIIYNTSWRIPNDAVQQIIAHISAVVLFASIGFGALVVYPIAFFRGAGFGERVLACLVTPVAWNIKEIVRVTEFFTIGESLYYGLNQVFLLSIFGAFAEMGVCELICRWRLNKTAEMPVKLFSAFPVVSILTGVAAVFVFLVWGLGVHFFYHYMEVYKAIFH